MERIGFAAGIELQGEVLEERRAHMVGGGRAVAERLSGHDEVGLVGIGASYAAALCGERALRDLGVRAVAFEAGDLLPAPPGRMSDAYIVLSASGKSVETLRVLRRLKQDGAPSVIGVTAEGHSPMSTLVDVELPCASTRDSVPATTSFTGSLQALAFCSLASVGGDLEKLESGWAEVPRALSYVANASRTALTGVLQQLARSESVDVVATRGSFGVAAEGVLLFREATRIPASCFDAHAYLHGPMESLERRRALVVLGDLAEEAAAVALSQGAALGCPTVAIGGPVAPAGVVHVPLPNVGGLLATQVLETIVLQVITESCSATLGLTSGRFRYPQPQLKEDQPS